MYLLLLLLLDMMDCRCFNLHQHRVLRSSGKRVVQDRGLFRLNRLRRGTHMLLLGRLTTVLLNWSRCRVLVASFRRNCHHSLDWIVVHRDEVLPIVHGNIAALYRCHVVCPTNQQLFLLTGSRRQQEFLSNNKIQ
uniref:(northern house mosquito) hypothetical protein n=1 Tax=Culex pipiens TaxID=7175 RepID=A0A8D8A7I9_CULPI